MPVNQNRDSDSYLESDLPWLGVLEPLLALKKPPPGAPFFPEGRLFILLITRADASGW